MGLDRDLGFCEDFKAVKGINEVEYNHNFDDNNKDDNNDKSISALALDRDLGVSRGYQGSQGHQPYDDDKDEEEDDDEVEDNNKDDNNNNDRGISAMGLDRDLQFL